MKHLRQDKRGISNVIVMMLSLVLVVIIVANVILWSYQMNQLDLDRMQEKVEITTVTRIAQGAIISLENKGSVTAHLVALWVDSPTIHQRYSMNLILNAGDSTNYTSTDIDLTDNASVIKIVTERGNLSVFKVS
jgi:Na+-transporting NADH:ubiquinone oxidoreductase subunit NqrC